MILYKSTRGNDKKLYTFSEAILKGIALDGGLLSPAKIPRFSLKQLRLLKNKSYQQIALFVFNLFQTDLSKDILQKIVNNAYSRFDNPDIVPVVHLKDNQYILELWHGPSLAFKDIALQIMPLFFSEAIKKQKKPLHYLILVATSGDTGKAAMEGFKDKKNIFTIVFYPNSRVSQLQELQMRTQEGTNVAVYAVKGDFDTTQKLVKDVLNDREFNQTLHNKFQTVLSSANSINWGRLIPQIIYHISSYLQLVDRNVIKLGEQIDIAVPTGNFGNILGAFYAKKMGVPIRKLICASNTNNVLTKFLQTGIYDIEKRKLVQTPSPSMDILIASNIERLLYAVTNNSKKVSRWMYELKTKGRFEVDTATKAILEEIFYADWVANEECLLNIKKVYQEVNYLMDPHTSVAQTVAEKYIQQKKVSLPLVICSTAHWAKFAKDVYKALTGKQSTYTDESKILEEVHELVPQSFIPSKISNLQGKSIKHKGKCAANIKDVEDIILNQIQYM